MRNLKTKAAQTAVRVVTHKSEGIDKILVTVGMCIVALLLIVILNTELGTFITTLFTNLTTKAQGILGV